MTPITFKTVYLSLALLALPQVLAGPACTSRYYGQPDCIRKCGGGWTYGGDSKGHNIWGFGSLSSACGLDTTSTSDSASVPTSSPPTDGYMPTPSVLSNSPRDALPDLAVSSPSPTTSSAPSAQTPVPAHDSIVDTTSDSPNSVMTAALILHNNYRALHDALTLSWSVDLANHAKNWTSQCVFQYSHGIYGENLAVGPDGSTIAQLFKQWTNESTSYDPSNPTSSHFTQVVWRGTTQLGCAIVNCPAGTVFPNDSSRFLACEYNAPGNVIGEFGNNVQV